MDHKEIHAWEVAVDTADRNPITADLPVNPTPGQLEDAPGPDQVVRRWIAVQIVAGNVGGRWAYWKNYPGSNGTKPHPEFHAVADKVFNGEAAHFVGMLAIPYVPVPGTRPIHWVLVDPKPAAPVIIPVVEQPLTGPRYERSDEEYNLDTKEMTPVRKRRSGKVTE